MTPDKHKYYPVRAENSMIEVNKWIAYAKKQNPKQKFLVEEIYKKRMKSPEKRYWEMRYKLGFEHKYMIYGSY